MSKWDSFGSKTLYNFNLPALSEEETLDLIKKAKKNDKESQEKLIFHNIKLILYTIKKFDHNSNYLEDLLEEAIFGFIEAINTYDDSRGKFSTYAVWMMRKYLIHSSLL